MIIEELLVDLNLENNAKNIYLLDWNIRYIRGLQLLYELHCTYPNLYYAGVSNGTPVPLHMEPPPITLISLVSIDHIVSHIRKYVFLGYSTDNFKNFDINAFSSCRFIKEDLPYILPAIYEYNSELWYAHHNVHSPLAWVFRGKPLFLSNWCKLYEKK